MRPLKTPDQFIDLDCDEMALEDNSPHGGPFQGAVL
jgi:hypothetical protein